MPDTATLIRGAEALEKVPFGFYLFMAIILILLSGCIVVITMLLKGRWDGLLEDVKAMRLDMDALKEVVTDNSKLREAITNINTRISASDLTVEGLRQRIRALEKSDAGVRSLLLAKGVARRESDFSGHEDEDTV